MAHDCSTCIIAEAPRCTSQVLDITGGVLVGRVASDSAPGLWYELWYYGGEAAGGTVTPRTKWACECSSKRKPCKHLNKLWAHAVAAGKLELTAEGRALLLAKGAQAAPPVVQASWDEPTAVRSSLKRAAETTKGQPTTLPDGRVVLYSIGHGQRPLGEIVDELQRATVSLVVDVRTWTTIRWARQYDVAELARPGALGCMRYVHMPKLGAYEQDGAPRRKDVRWFAGIRWLAEQAGRETLALLCLERDHTACHRHLVIEPDLTSIDPRLAMIHLGSTAKAPVIEPQMKLGM